MLLHRLVRLSHTPVAKRFSKGLGALEATQRKLLGEILALASKTEAGGAKDQANDYESFAKARPITEYGDWKALIEKQKASRDSPILCSPIVRFEPTSGSTEARKWIPYSRGLLDAFDRAAAPWLHDIGKRYPRSLKGRHYWSLSWIPPEIRAEVRSTDDSELLPVWKQALMKAIFAIDPASLSLESLEESMKDTALILAQTRDLTLLSVWSPTYALEIIDLLITRSAELAEKANAETRTILKRAPAAPNADFLKELWPNLALVSAWNSGSSAMWAQKLQKLLPHADFQPKGLWATEGVVTIPFQGAMPLAYLSHFYEFESIDTGEVLPSWKLKTGQLVRPILTTQNGLTRYRLPDRLQVDGFLQSVPSLRFIAREKSVDLVGEKLDHSAAVEMLAQIATLIDPLTPVALIAETPPNGRPRYLLLIEGPANATAPQAARIDALLCKYHHYSVARSLHQLDPIQVLVLPQARAHLDRTLRQNATSGGKKIEPVIHYEGCFPRT